MEGLDQDHQATISKLTRVKELRLYGSDPVRIPPEIGELEQLEIFDIYTSYRLHWLQFEITRRTNLKSSRISTRALYGNTNIDHHSLG